MIAFSVGASAGGIEYGYRWNQAIRAKCPNSQKSWRSVRICQNAKIQYHSQDDGRIELKPLTLLSDFLSRGAISQNILVNKYI